MLRTTILSQMTLEIQEAARKINLLIKVLNLKREQSLEESVLTRSRLSQQMVTELANKRAPQRVVEVIQTVKRDLLSLKKVSTKGSHLRCLILKTTMVHVKLMILAQKRGPRLKTNILTL